MGQTTRRGEEWGGEPVLIPQRRRACLAFMGPDPSPIFCYITKTQNQNQRHMQIFEECTFIESNARKARRVPSIYGTRSEPNLLAARSPEISTKLHSF